LYKLRRFRTIIYLLFSIYLKAVGVLTGSLERLVLHDLEEVVQDHANVFSLTPSMFFSIKKRHDLQILSYTSYREKFLKIMLNIKKNSSR
jgi:hypothetical protein